MSAALATIDKVHTVVDLLRWRAAQTPGAPAFRQRDAERQWQSTTWGDFAGQVDALARGLFLAGARPGDRLAVIAPVSLAWELLHHAALAAGCVVVGLDAHDCPDRLSHMLALAQVRHLACADGGLLQQLASAPPAGSTEGQARPEGLRIVLPAPPSIATAADNPTGKDHLETAFSNISDLQGQGMHGAWPTGHAHPAQQDDATIIFTSGTTGSPKGIVYRHDQLLQAALAIQQAFGFVGPAGRLLCWLPLSNLFQRMVNLAAIRSGTASYLVHDPRAVVEMAGEVQPDILVAVPRFFEKLLAGVRAQASQAPWPTRRLIAWAWSVGHRYRRLQRQGAPVPGLLRLQHALADRLVLARIRRVLGDRLVCLVSGSAPAGLGLLEDLHALGWLVLEAYGLSENVMPMAMNRLDAWRFGTVGQPLPANQLRVDTHGELQVRGSGVFSGYLGDATDTGLDAEGYYRTGDIGHVDDRGFLVLTGRASELIKTSTGRRIAPANVEAVLAAVPGIDQAIVLGHGRKQLVALCTLADPAALHALNLALQRAVAKLSSHERPAALALLPQPFSMARDELTPNLKLRRQVIASHHAELVEQLHRAVEQRSPGDLLILPILGQPAPGR